MTDHALPDPGDQTRPVDVDVARGARDGDWVVTLTGELDVASSPELRTRLEELLGRAARLITVDLGALTFIDSSGLGVLVGAHKQLRESGGETIVLRSMQEPVRRVFEITGLTKLFTVEE